MYVRVYVVHDTDQINNIGCVTCGVNNVEETNGSRQEKRTKLINSNYTRIITNTRVIFGEFSRGGDKRWPTFSIKAIKL